MNKADILALLPSVISSDESLRALAESIAGQLILQETQIDQAKIYAGIDKLPEDMLDILAKDFKVDWWSQHMSLEDKRETLKTSWRVHRRLGTKAAVLDAISSVYKYSEIEEWFGYDGSPYHFKIIIDSSYRDTDLNKYNAVINNVAYYKNVRSVLQSVEYGHEAVTVTAVHGAFEVAHAQCDGCKTVNKAN